MYLTPRGAANEKSVEGKASAPLGTSADSILVSGTCSGEQADPSAQGYTALRYIFRNLEQTLQHHLFLLTRG